MTKEELMNLSLEDFEKQIQLTYDYDENGTNCLWYSYVWDQYFINKNWSSQIVIVDDTHSLVIARNDTQYCVSDQTNVNCFHLGFEEVEN